MLVVMSDLNALVPALKRAVAPPGRFVAVFPEAQDSDLVGQLADALGAVQLDGYLGSFATDVDAETVTPDVTQAQGALLVMYASIRMLRNEIRNRKSHVHYEAKGAVFEEDTGASVMVEMLRDLRAEQQRFLDNAKTVGLASAFYMADLAFIKEMREYEASDLDPINYSVV